MITNAALIEITWRNEIYKRMKINRWSRGGGRGERDLNPHVKFYPWHGRNCANSAKTHITINILDLLYINIQIYITPGYVSIRFHKIILWINFELDREWIWYTCMDIRYPDVHGSPFAWRVLVNKYKYTYCVTPIIYYIYVYIYVTYVCIYAYSYHVHMSSFALQIQ